MAVSNFDHSLEYIYYLQEDLTLRYDFLPESDNAANLETSVRQIIYGKIEPEGAPSAYSNEEFARVAMPMSYESDQVEFSSREYFKGNYQFSNES